MVTLLIAMGALLIAIVGRALLNHDEEREHLIEETELTSNQHNATISLFKALRPAVGEINGHQLGSDLHRTEPDGSG